MAYKEFFRQVIACLAEADRDGLLSDKGQDVLGGLSGRATVGALQRLVGLFKDDPAACYLEIGVFQGLSLLSVAIENPGMPCFGIDNFSILDPKGENLGIVGERTRRLGVANATLVNDDFENALERLGEHIGSRRLAVYFIDGAHDYRSQLVGLLLGMRWLHEQAVIIVDDANYPDVRQSTRDFLLAHPEFKMVFEAYSPAHPANLDKETLARFEAGWLNGVNVLVRDPENRLPVMLPPVPQSRELYVNDWLVHRHRLAELAPQALEMAETMLDGADPAPVLAKIRTAAPEDRFADRNVFSQGLPEKRFTAWE